MDRKTVLLSLGIGVGVAAAVGGVIYALLKEDVLSDGSKVVSSRPVTVELRIDQSNVGIVIGRGGETIKDIQSKTNTRINFKDELATETERVLVIRGDPNEVQLAEILIHQTIANQPRIETLEMIVPKYAVGYIIGKKGETIRKLQHISKCRIDVERNDSGDVRKVNLKGTAEQIEAGKHLVEEKVDEAESATYAKSKTENNAPTRLGFKESLFLKAENGTDDNCSSSKESFESLKMVTGEKYLSIFVSSICNPNYFFVQKVGPNSVELDKLTQEMTNFYEKEVNQQLQSLSNIEVGDIVAAQWHIDGQWYRAKVRAVIRDEYDESVSAEIDFVDYGDFDMKQLKYLFRLISEFKKLPFQAIPCSLAKIKPRGQDWTEEACDDFERLTKCAQWKEMHAEIVGFLTNPDSSSTPLVNLTNPGESETSNISQELVRLGHALEVENAETR